MTEPVEHLDPEAQPWPVYFGLVEVLAEVLGPEIYKVEATQLPAWVRERLAAAPVPCAAPEFIDPSSERGQQMIRNSAFMRPTTQGDPPPEERDDTLRRNADSLSGGAEVDGAGHRTADRDQYSDAQSDRARADDGRRHDAEAVDVDAQRTGQVAVPCAASPAGLRHAYVPDVYIGSPCKVCRLEVNHHFHARATGEGETETFRDWLARQVEACARRAVNDNTKKSREYHGHTRILLQGILAEYDRRISPDE